MNYVFNSFYGLKAFRKIATGTTSVAAIYTKDLLKINIIYPSLPEQQKIASFLSTLDEKIEQVGLQFEKTQAWKKGLLQKMFV